MAKPIQRRMAADIEGDFVVFLIGVRIHRMWKVWKWWPVFMAMPRMLTELSKHPELGLMHFRSHFSLRNAMVIQYWRSFEQLHAYATDRTRAHFPAWKSFNQKIASNGDVGIWHETYLVKAGAYEAIYNSMPPFGLGQAGTLVPAEGRRASAVGRLNQTASPDPQDL